jgi:hypothetical protein
VTNGVFVTLADTLMDPTLVLVAFVSTLTGSPILIGLVAPLRDAVWFLPQLALSGWLQSRPRRLDVYGWTVYARVLLLGAVAVAVYLIREPLALLIAFFVLFGAYALASGVSGLPFLEVVTKTIPPQQRAQFFAWRLFLGGILSLGAAALVRWVLDEQAGLPFPDAYVLLFSLSLVAYALGWIAFMRIAEPADPVLRPRASALDQLRRAGGLVLADPAYRVFLLMRLAFIVAGAVIPFVAVHTQTRLGGSRAMIGVYLSAFTLALLVANALFGRFAERLGNRRILIGSAGAGLMMMLAVVALLVAAAAGPLAPAWVDLWLVPVFALSGVREAGLAVAGMPFLMDVAKAEDRTLYLGFTNTLLGAATLITGLSGVFVQLAGFESLLGVSVAAFGVALWGLSALRRFVGG